MESGYNGWTNKETWAVGLWVDNDEPTYSARIALVRAVLESAGEEYDDDSAGYPIPKGAVSRADHQRHKVEDAIEEWVTGELLPDLGASLAADLLNSAVAKVNWRELAEHWIEEVGEEG